MATSSFQWGHLPQLLKNTYKGWNNDDPWRQSAVVAYYAIFSLPALLIIVITIAGSIFGQDAVQGRLSTEFTAAIGADAAKEIETMISNAYQQKSSLFATIAGIATLIFGATGVFYQLQQSLNRVWEVEADQDSGVKKLIMDRVSSFGVILVIGFLLLVSLMLTTALSVLSDFIKNNLPDYLLYVFYIAEIIISLGIITLLFAMIYKILPDVNLQWRTVWVGAGVTALLFVIGKYALSFYFGMANPGSAYGAAGSLILILLWVSYSCLILFFGAEFTQVYARRYNHPISPSKHARKSTGYDKKHGIGADTRTNDNADSEKDSKSKSKQTKKTAATTDKTVVYVQRSQLRSGEH